MLFRDNNVIIFAITLCHLYLRPEFVMPDESLEIDIEQRHMVTDRSFIMR